MNISLKQTSSNLKQWQYQIKSFVKSQQQFLNNVFVRKDCSKQMKVNIMEGFKQVLKIKLKQVNSQKIKFQSNNLQKQENILKLTRDKDDFVISNKCLKQVDNLQMELLMKLQGLIQKKNTIKSQKKNQLKSQGLQKSKNKSFEGFFIPNAKMVSSIIIGANSNSSQMNKSTRLIGEKTKRSDNDKSLQIRSKMQNSQIYKNQVCVMLQPILQEARQIFTKNKLIIKTLKSGLEQQIELNLWMKEIKLAAVTFQITEQNKINKIENQQQILNLQFYEKHESDTTGSPDQKGTTPKDESNQNQNQKKFDCQPRKNLLAQEQRLSKLLSNNVESYYQLKLQSSIQLSNKKLQSQKSQQKMTQKIDNFSLIEDKKSENNKQFHSSQKISNNVSMKFDNISYNRLNQVKQSSSQKLKQQKEMDAQVNKNSHQQQGQNASISTKKGFFLSNIGSSSYQAEQSVKQSNRISQINNVIIEQEGEQKQNNSVSSQSSEQFYEIAMRQQEEKKRKQIEQKSKQLQSKIQANKRSIKIRNQVIQQEQKNSINNLKVQKVVKQSRQFVRNSRNIFKQHQQLNKNAIKFSNTIFNSQNKQNQSILINTINDQKQKKDSINNKNIFSNYIQSSTEINNNNITNKNSQHIFQQPKSNKSSNNIFSNKSNNQDSNPFLQNQSISNPFYQGNNLNNCNPFNINKGNNNPFVVTNKPSEVKNIFGQNINQTIQKNSNTSFNSVNNSFSSSVSNPFGSINIGPSTNLNVQRRNFTSGNMFRNQVQLQSSQMTRMQNNSNDDKYFFF